jgi:mannose-6-phosphate isomerase
MAVVSLPADALHDGERASLAGARAELAKLETWLIEDALPVWASAGFDTATGAFHERLDFAGRPILAAPRRLMAQCRQIYAFSHATLLGWFDGRESARRALASLLATYRGRVDGVPYVFSVARDGAVVDARQDSYGYAFALFAFAWARRLLGDAVDPTLAEGLLSHFDTALAHPSGEGFVCDLPRRDRFLRQNPHMHLFEAALEVEDAFGSSTARRLSDRLYRLFRKRLLLADAKALPELHDDDWRTVESPEATFEPGHHFEWIWLLDRYAARSGESVDDLVQLLAARGYAEGIDESGAAIEAVGARSGRRVENRRCWATCAGLMAAASDFEAGRDRAAAADRAAGFLRALRRNFVGRPFRGGWVDRVAADGAPLVDFVPASTLYHLVSAAAEADRALKLPTGVEDRP